MERLLSTEEKSTTLNHCEVRSLEDARRPTTQKEESRECSICKKAIESNETGGFIVRVYSDPIKNSARMFTDPRCSVKCARFYLEGLIEKHEVNPFSFPEIIAANYWTCDFKLDWRKENVLLESEPLWSY